MKSIILLLASMAILSGCDMGVNIGDGGTSGDTDWDGERRTIPDDDDYTKWYSADVYVKFENGEPCKDSYAVHMQDSIYYYSNSEGYILVVKMYSFESDKPPDYKTILCDIYMDRKEPPVFVQQEFIMKHSDDIPQYNVVFPDSLRR